MTSPALATPPAPATTRVRPLYRLSVEQYHRMIESGVLHSGDRIELLDGYLVCKMTQYPPHASTVGKLQNAMPRLVPAGWLVRSQLPITLAESEPEPDFTIVRGSTEEYEERHPGAVDIALVIEVAESRLEDDRGWKAQIYARARIPTYWIVNLVDQQVEVYTRPVAGRSPRFRDSQVLGRGASVSVALGSATLGPIAVNDMLPPPPPT